MNMCSLNQHVKQHKFIFEKIVFVLALYHRYRYTTLKRYLLGSASGVFLQTEAIKYCHIICMKLYVFLTCYHCIATFVLHCYVKGCRVIWDAWISHGIYMSQTYGNTRIYVMHWNLSQPNPAQFRKPVLFNLASNYVSCFNCLCKTNLCNPNACLN